MPAERLFEMVAAFEVRRRRAIAKKPVKEKKMAKQISRQAVYCQRVRAELLEKLGGKCVKCGEDNQEELEFDHIYGRAYEARKLSSSARMARYKREAAANKLRILCGDCNKAERKKNDAGAHVKTGELIPLTMEMKQIVEEEI